jgi:glucosamine--fructose-6-phosphate aminotransferase (isomerizing)
MKLAHPMLTNLRALGDPAVWQKSIDLAEEALSAWSAPRAFKHIFLAGHGSSLYNGLVGASILEHIAEVRAKALPAFAFSTYTEKRLLDPQTLVIGISTTGGTESVFHALAGARQAGARTLAITAHSGSEITHHADMVILTGGEDDQLSVKTRSYVQALIPLYLLAIHLAGKADLRSYWVNQIMSAAAGAQDVLENRWGQIKQLAGLYARAPNVFVLGTGPNLGTAEEASLKVIEMAKMYSECQELEDFFHGRLREVDQNSPLFFLAPRGLASDRVLDFLTVTGRIKAPSIVLTDRITPGVQRLATHVVHLPVELDEFATPLLYVLPMHIFGYEMALQRGYDPAARRYDIIPQTVKYREER